MTSQSRGRGLHRSQSFWRARWREGRTAFHEGRPNAFLQAHLRALGEQRRVLVPLCGKSEDLAFLAAAGHDVVGVEAAAAAFFSEHSLIPSRSPQGKLTALAAGRVTILVGNLFDCTPAEVGALDALYDRAAPIALPARDRARYVQCPCDLLPGGARDLLVTVEYPQELMEGPPFSVPEVEVRALYAGRRVELLGQGVASGRFKQEGIAATEKCFARTF